jgi:hypothetical protein
VSRPTFAAACAQYVHRYTMEHRPAWAMEPAPNGKYYAPQFRSDREWYTSTRFPGEPGHPTGFKGICYTTGQTWPLGEWLERPVGFTLRIGSSRAAYHPEWSRDRPWSLYILGTAVSTQPNMAMAIADLRTRGASGKITEVL